MIAIVTMSSPGQRWWLRSPSPCGHVAAGCQSRLALGGEPIGVEGVGVVEDVGVAHVDVDRADHAPALRDVVAADLQVVDGLAEERRGVHREVAPDLLRQLAEVVHPGELLHGDLALGRDGQHLLAGPLAQLRALAQHHRQQDERHEEPGLPGEDQVPHVAVQLLGRDPVFGRLGEHAGDDVVVLLGVLLVLLDRLRDQHVEALAPLEGLGVRRPRDRQRQDLQGVAHRREDVVELLRRGPSTRRRCRAQP